MLHYLHTRIVELGPSNTIVTTIVIDVLLIGRNQHTDLYLGLNV